MEGTCIVRHRMSGYHSFRTAVCKEWVVRGTIAYRIRFTKLTAPFSCGIGVVTPKTDINSDVAWCPGTRGWKNAWGLCIEGTDDDDNPRDNNHHHEARAITEPFVLGGSSKHEIVNSDFLLAHLNNNGVEFRVVIDATNRSLQIEGPFLQEQGTTQHSAKFCIKLTEEEEEDNDAVMSAENTTKNNETVMNKPLPLALTVSLKFAGDEAILLPCV